jgi:TonB-linked SusC/RagA family outer membrane protein
MRKIVSLLAVSLLFIATTFAQNKTVTGKVTESSGGPVSGATISVGGKSIGATNANGEFTISVPASATSISVSSIGFETMTLKLTGAPLAVSLAAASANSVSEVVVTGYTTIQRKKFSGAIATAPTQEIRKQPFGSFDQALQGQAAGVSVIGGSGQPGSGGTVRIRGNGSISGGNYPLYIMDGIEISAGDFATLNQGDFERVEILKDAVATAMYGSRGASGVIVITTRRGRAGQLQLSYDAQYGISDMPKDRLEVMTSDEKIAYELKRGNGYGWDRATADSLRKVNFSWKDALFQRGITRQHMVSASGGSQASKFFASLSYMDQEGIVKTTGMKRYTARINVDNTVKNWRFGMNLQAGWSNIQRTSENDSYLSSPLNAVRWSNPYERDIDPTTGDYQQYGGPGYLISGQPNGAMDLFLNSNKNLQLKSVASSYLEYHFPFLKGLSARTNWGLDFSNNEYTQFWDPRTTGYQTRQGALYKESNRSFRYTGTTSLSYKRTFGKHEVDGGVFTESIKNDFRRFNFIGYGFTNGFTNETGITAGSAANPSYIPSVGGTGTANGLLSYFGIFNYGYSDKYFLSLVGRRDGSSRFGVNNRFANFGSAGLTWAVSDEKFMSKIKFINDLRLRASIGTTGNNNTAAGDFPLPQFGRSSYAGISGWAPAAAGNLDYRWETNKTTNFGLDFAMFKRRLSGTVEIYNRTTTDLFYSLPIDPSISGFSSVPSNFGTVRNKGVELTLRGDIIRTKNFSWSIGANLTYNENRIIDLPTDSVVSSNIILKEGRPLNTHYLVSYGGVNPANGNSQYIKKDGSVTMAYTVADATYQGTSDAPWFGGLNTNFSYKGFDLSAQMNFFLKNYLYNNDRNNLTNPAYLWDNMHNILLREWRSAGQITDVPRPTSGATAAGPSNPYRSATTRFLEDGSFWRLRNVTLGYTFNTKLLSKATMRSARIFIQGQNWWTKTKYMSFDPEMSGTTLVGAQYPALVQTTVGLSIGF